MSWCRGKRDPKRTRGEGRGRPQTHDGPQSARSEWPSEVFERPPWAGGGLAPGRASLRKGHLGAKLRRRAPWLSKAQAHS